MRLITTDIMSGIVRDIGASALIQRIRERMELDFANWDSFTHSARYAHYIAEGAIELMPTGDSECFSYKYVNGHPGNVAKGFPSIMALGQLSDCRSGLPLVLCEMTILTALRTGATTQLAASYGARSDSEVLCVIGNGTQSVFQAIALCDILPIREIRYYDIDSVAMETFAGHMHTLFSGIKLSPAKNPVDAAYGAEVIVTVTEAFGHQNLLSLAHVKPGVFVAAVGGDCPGKTELAADLVEGADILVEFEPQTRKEGEIQRCPDKSVRAHLHELVRGRATARSGESTIVMFDSVGFALEDYSALRVMHEIAEELDLARVSLVPEGMDNVKDLYGHVMSTRA